MSLKHPKSLEEWRDYISMLSGVELRSKARAANSWSFVQMLMKEGMSPSEISELFWLLAQQFVATGQMPPNEDAYTNLFQVAESCPKLKPILDTLE